MRVLTILALLAIATAATASAQKPSGEPVDLLEAMGLTPDQERVRAAIEAAAVHPLGSRENPVRVGGPRGERAYIARLRCADGSRPRVGLRGSVGVGPFLTILDAYPLDCGAASPGQVTLFMDMYHSQHAEDRAPPEFTIVPD